MELVHDRVYSDRQELFQAWQGDTATQLPWALFRLVRTATGFARVTTPGELAGYCQDAQGVWWQMRCGDPEQGQKPLAFWLCLEFETEIAPTLEYVADSPRQYLEVSGMYRIS